MADFPYSGKQHRSVSNRKAGGSSTTPAATITEINQTLANGNTSLGRVLQHAKELSRLDAVIHSFLDPDLAQQCQVAAFRDKVLIILSPSATWATRLRMHLPQLRRDLQCSGYSDIEQIEVRISPLTRRSPEIRRRKTLSPAAQITFEQFAQLSLKAEELKRKNVKSEFPDGE
jgi:hypothetical protein